MNKLATTNPPLNKAQKGIRKFLQSELGMTESEVNELATSGGDGWIELLAEYKKREDLENLKLLTKIRAAIEKKLESGSLEQAQKGATALAIISDKIYMQSKDKNSVLTIGQGAEKIAVSLNFPFKPYGSKTKRIK